MAKEEKTCNEEEDLRAKVTKALQEMNLPEDSFRLNETGICYMNGWGVEKDESVGFSYFLKAAENGFGAAQMNVSRSYFLGIGVETDYTEGLNWLRKAVENENADAEFFLGLLYMNGDGGLELNEEEAFKLFEKAAKHGSIDGQLQIGRCYENGTGIAKDYKMAAECYKKAAKDGREEAQDALDDLKDRIKEEAKEAIERVNIGVYDTITY